MITRLLTSASVFFLLTGSAWAAEKDEIHLAFFDLQNPELWVFVALVLFIVVLYKPITKTLTTKLDGRAEAIKSELDEAQRLREEAQHTLAEYQRKQRDALKEAEGIIAEAREEAGRIEKAAAERTAELLARREQQALDMIAAAEAQALADVRGQAADVAIAATQQLLVNATQGDGGDALLEQAIEELPSKLN
ncbi:MAG: F0F1 ATP synthase subunit B [Alphaproteobacteria bacterium]|nr:F0F1 ATP synthase subunit B [Alphaproteobacteria bacterium]